MNIFVAVRNNNFKEVEDYINNGADINTRDSGGWTLIHYACWDGHHDIAHLLLKNGADINTRDNNGWTPLQVACHWGHYDIVHSFLPPFSKEEYEGITSFNNFWRIL